MYSSRRLAATMAVISMLSAGMSSSGGGAYVKPIEKTRMKGLSSEEMGTKGNGKKLSRAKRKAKAMKINMRKH